MAGQGYKIFGKATNDNRLASNTQIQTNPIITRKNSNGNFGGYKYSNKLYEYQSNINIVEILNELFNEASRRKTLDEAINYIHSAIINKLNCSFTAVGIVNAQANYLNLKLTDYIGGVYSSRIQLNDTDNKIVNCFNNKEVCNIENFSMLNIPHLNTLSGWIFPLVYQGEAVGVFIVGSSVSMQHNIEILNIVSNYLTLCIKNKEMSEKINPDENIDSLTGLKNHRDFQEHLTSAIKKADESDDNLSVIILDVDNFTQINREFGHAKGDEILRMVADKIRQNIRSVDIAGRYGGDEIALILPSTDNKEACKMAEYLNSNITCSLVDDIGHIKVSIGVSTYPTCTREQEKLLLLSEQAMLISKNKTYKDGASHIVSAQKIDFWNEMALDSLANVIAKRHSQWGINYEEELVQKFHNESLSSKSHIMDVVTSLAGAIDAKDPYTKGHSTAVSRYAEALARTLNLPEDKVERIKLGAMLHDVGKIGIPEPVLRKPTALTPQEWEVMQQHPSIGAHKVLGPISSLRDLIPMIEHHHENWNGSGYPSKLKGEDIPFEARIVAIADAFHALISDRPYRKGLSLDIAMKILREGAGIQWDKDLIRKFLTIAPSLFTTV